LRPHFHNKTRVLLLLLVSLVAGIRSEAQKPAPSLAELQREFAMHYLEPEPHMALAKYYFDHGDRIQAFFVSEAARRGRFEEQVFNPAFYRAFDGFDNGKPAEARLLAYFAEHPDSLDTLDELADIYISREEYDNARRYLTLALQKKPDDYKFTAGLASVLRAQDKPAEADQLLKDYQRKFPETPASYEMRSAALSETKPLEARSILEAGLKQFPNDGGLLFALGLSYQSDDKQKAEELLVKAAAASPKTEGIQSWVGRFFFKIRNDKRRALEYYLNAYFLNPHAYESEFVESRIQNIVYALASEKLEKNLKDSTELSLLSDPDPVLVSLVLDRLSQKWLPVYVKPVAALLGHDDQGVRWQAMELLKTKVDASFDEQLKFLLQDNDLRKRGMAAYIAVFRWKEKSLGVMQNFLAHDAELLRFDAISALMIDGGPPGHELALKHAAREPNAVLKKMILTAGPNTP
jgi:tetratricopeptide repeat protein